MDKPTPKRPAVFIEKMMPVQVLNEQVNFEHGGNPFKGLHRWYSRKPLSFSRASVLASLLPADITMQEFEYLLGLVPGKEVKLYKTPPNSVQIKKVQDYCEKVWGTRTPTVLDAFAGGGSIPFEAARYGLNVLASDLNPVAVVTMKAAMEYPLKFGPDLQQDIDKWVKWVGDEAQKRLAEFFPSLPGETVQNYLWAHTVVCPSCESVVPLSPTWWLDKSPTGTRKGEWCAVKPISNSENKRIDFELIKAQKGKGTTIKTDNGEYDPDTTTTISRGVGKCPNCNSIIEDEIIKNYAQSHGLGHQLYAVVYRKGSSSLFFRTPTELDYKGIEKANLFLENKKNGWELAGLIPSQEIPENTHRGPDMYLYGIYKWHEMFNPRQLLTLATYIEVINEAKEIIKSNYQLEKEQAILSYLALVVDRCADRSCRLARWDSSRTNAQGCSAQHALNLMWNYPESSGAYRLWEWCAETAASDYIELCSLFGSLPGFTGIPGIEEHNPKNIQIDAASADSLTHIPNNFIDAIVTDPPYYDSIRYGEISDFFYVWLRANLLSVFPDLFFNELTDKDREAIANPGRFRNMGVSPEELANQDYEAKMAMAFAEYHRVLRDDGVMTVQFNHKDSGAWDVLAKSLIDAGFEITASWAVSTENPQNLHQAQKNAVSSTVLLVCRKRDPNAEQAWWDDVRIDVRNIVFEKAPELEKCLTEDSRPAADRVADPQRRIKPPGINLCLSAFGSAFTSRDTSSEQDDTATISSDTGRDTSREQDAPTTKTEINSEQSSVISQPSTVISEQERLAFTQLANIHEHPGCLDFCLKSIPIHPWPHQIKILRRVAQNFPQSFLIADEVGLGKTIETGLILRYLLLSKKVKRILILAPASVQPQWQEELREKFNLHFWSYTSTEFKDPYKRTIPAAANPWNTQDLILASSHLVRRTDRMHQLLSAEPWDLVILDEAHHARRKSPQDRKETPNRLLQLMAQLKEKTKSLILLSATPMQIDAIEVFDLLNLLGLQGHWSYGDNFCYYFASLQGAVKQEVINFWQVMSSDYFGRGGQSCSRLEQFLTKSDRILAYKMQDTWQRGKKISNHKQLLADEDFIDTSRQYLTVNTPLKDLMFRHTRDTLRQYYQRGLLERDIPTRVVQDNAITLEPQREVPLYVAVSDYVRHFYRLAQIDQRSCLGFLMTLYRKRLTSSFYAIKSSLQRRLDYLLTQRGSVLSDDDLVDVDNEDDAVIAGLESFFEPVDPQEIQYLEELLRQFENTGEDSKLSRFIQILRQELTDRESAIVFTQYTDTMDYLRDTLKELYGSQVACYSGRGGELYQNGEWCLVPKEEIKRRFRQDEIKILLCTESASEGLNLQNCGVLINYDMPWNPMRVEQRIGRIDRIGQRYPTVRIHNFYYDGTVEAKVYRKLRDRINAFATVVGNLQPILAQVPTFIERAVMSADPEEEDVLMSQFDSVLDSPPPRLAIEEMVAMDLDADLAEIQKPIPSAPFTPETIEQLFTSSAILKANGVQFERRSEGTWQLNYEGQNYMVTFYPSVFDDMPSLRLMNFGDPLFEQLLKAVKI